MTGLAVVSPLGSSLSVTGLSVVTGACVRVEKIVGTGVAVVAGAVDGVVVVETKGAGLELVGKSVMGASVFCTLGEASSEIRRVGEIVGTSVAVVGGALDGGAVETESIEAGPGLVGRSVVGASVFFTLGASLSIIEINDGSDVGLGVFAEVGEIVSCTGLLVGATGVPDGVCVMAVLGAVLGVMVDLSSSSRLRRSTMGKAETVAGVAPTPPL